MPHLLLLTLGALAGATPPTCASHEADAAFQEGFSAQKRMETTEALGQYDKCLKLDPTCVPCQYEIGWSHWAAGTYALAAHAWERTLELEPSHAGAAQWLPQARNQGAGSQEGLSPNGVRIPMGTRSRPADAPVTLELVARFQNYRMKTERETDQYDTDINSPKSVRFLPDGSKVYVNSLEGLRTPVYDAKTLTKRTTIEHLFRKEHAGLFHDQTTVFDYPYYRSSPAGDPNVFGGKPVESELSHGRWLWVPYYRRDYDSGAASPSAVAIIDTTTDQIVRVLPTGPIPKYAAASPDGRWVAITHWGDNTLGIVDTASGDPETFAYRPDRLVVERALPQENLAGQDRDAACGFCLRGTIFTPDSRVLLVGRMGGGGIAGFDTETWAYLGSITGEPPTVRHLVISPDGKWLYLTSNRKGSISRIPLDAAVALLRGAKGERVATPLWEELDVGNGARTLDITPDGRHLFVAVNGDADIAVVDAAAWRVVSKVRTDKYTVGLAVSPDGTQVWTTSQGKGQTGGNSVCVYAVEYATP